MPDGKLDYKKEYEDLYMPKETPSLIEVPRIGFIMIDGKGDPNTADGEYHKAMQALYGLTYIIKMSKMSGQQPEGYFEYVVPPLEGLWWIEGSANPDFTQKEKFCWTSMIRQPEFVTPEVFDWAVRECQRKKLEVDVSKARFQAFEEGLCVQAMHIGPYDNEPATIAKLEACIRELGLINDIGTTLPDGMIRRHHEIYLSDPLKTKPEKLKTVIRHPVRRA